ncbi:MAG TPA: peptidoglycan DD-metalloendopeptidase family protein [Caldimonas sp.]|nr:peptidoglycan DD-metalloendopeptidase family protein [Caldimonas sp.]
MSLIEASASRLGALLIAVSILAACSQTPNRAPVEDRLPTPRTTVAAASPAQSPASAAEPGKVPGADANTGKPGFYTVKPGDTLIRIGLDNGQNWKDLMRWNNLGNPNLIEVGQVIRIVPPGVDPTAATSRPVTTARVETRSLEAKPGSAIVPQSTAASASASAASAAGASAPPAPARETAPAREAAPAAAREGDDDINWAWPSTVPVSTPFDEARNKGLVFRGKPGDPVYAAADGRVVYAGSGLRGYGNLVILKHNATYLTAYAHNQTLLVKDDQQVKRGQKIAEMGSTDADGVQLHFEIRKQGKPIDPARLLPAR